MGGGGRGHKIWWKAAWIGILGLCSFDPRSGFVGGRCLGAEPASRVRFAVVDVGGLQLAGGADGGGKQGVVLILRRKYASGRAWQISSAWAVVTKVRSPDFWGSCSSGTAL